MPIPGIQQPEVIVIDDTLRLRKYAQDCSFALGWYQDAETLTLVDGEVLPYTEERLYRMYHYLQDRGEVYFIEFRQPGEPFRPIGDVSFWQGDMPIVIGEKSLRGQGIGGKVIAALVRRGRELGYSWLGVQEIYDFNTGSRAMFEKAGFRAVKSTGMGHSYRLKLE